MPTLKHIHQDASVGAMTPAVMPAQQPVPALAPSLPSCQRQHQQHLQRNLWRHYLQRQCQRQIHFQRLRWLICKQRNANHASARAQAQVWAQPQKRPLNTSNAVQSSLTQQASRILLCAAMLLLAVTMCCPSTLIALLPSAQLLSLCTNGCTANEGQL